MPATASERSPGTFIHRGYEQSWNFTLEHKLPLNLITSVGYVGSHSVHLLADYDINSGYPGSGTTGLPYYAAYGRTVPTHYWDGYLSSNYNSLQVAVNRSLSKGLLVKAAYTYSHSIDYTDDDGWASVGWNWAPVFQRNRATAGFDRTHVLQIGWIYELPLGKGKMLAKSGVAAAVLGNWQVNGIMSAYTRGSIQRHQPRRFAERTEQYPNGQPGEFVGNSPRQCRTGLVLLRSNGIFRRDGGQHIWQQRPQHSPHPGYLEYRPEHHA